MCKKVEIASCRNLVEGGREYLYKYYLIESALEMDLNGFNVAVPCYGIFESVEEIFDGEDICFDEDAVEYVSPDRTKVMDLIYFLRDNNVSPVHLIDIIGEKVDKWVSDFDEVAERTIGKANVAQN